jgi:hypothetical protein
MSRPFPATTFPGRAIRAGQQGAEVAAIQRRLNALGCGPVDEDGAFGPQTLNAVQLFQARSEDPSGRPLEPDGIVGAHTWAALFQQQISSRDAAPDALLRETLDIARGEIGVREDPPNSNRGPKVDQYVREVGLNPASGFPWCAAFVYWCFSQGARVAGVSNPLIKTAGVQDHWQRAIAGGIHCISAAEAAGNPDEIQPGMIFVMGMSGGAGHTGLVERISGSLLTTIEGNTNDNGSREGIGVFRRSSRHIANINLGFINYGRK